MLQGWCFRRQSVCAPALEGQWATTRGSLSKFSAHGHIVPGITGAVRHNWAGPAGGKGVRLRAGALARLVFSGGALGRVCPVLPRSSIGGKVPTGLPLHPRVVRPQSWAAPLPSLGGASAASGKGGAQKVASGKGYSVRARAWLGFFPGHPPRSEWQPLVQERLAAARCGRVP